MQHEINVRLDLTDQNEDSVTLSDYVKNAINNALEDYFFSDAFKKSFFDIVVVNYIEKTFQAELSVKCREIINKMSVSDVFGYSCNNLIAEKTVYKALTEQHDVIKNKILELINKINTQDLREALTSYMNNELQNFTQLKVSLDRK